MGYRGGGGGCGRGAWLGRLAVLEQDSVNQHETHSTAGVFEPPGPECDVSEASGVESAQAFGESEDTGRGGGQRSQGIGDGPAVGNRLTDLPQQFPSVFESTGSHGQSQAAALQSTDTTDSPKPVLSLVVLDLQGVGQRSGQIVR